MVWRLAGGVLLGLSVFLVFRTVRTGTQRPTAWALGCALIAIGDPGFAGGQTLFGGSGLIRGNTPMSVPNALGQFRVVTPLLNLPALLVLAALTVPPQRQRPRTQLEILAGAVLLGLCVPLYFFFWTAAVVALSACLGLALLRGSKSERDFLGLVLIGGIAIGAPRVISNARTFSDPSLKPILQRTNRGRVLKADDPVRTRYLVNLWVYAKLAFGAAVIGGFVMSSRRAIGDALPASPVDKPNVPVASSLVPIWVFAASGFLLANSAIVTGLEFENFHWVYVHAPFGEILVLAGVAILLDRIEWARVGRWLWTLPIAVVLLASIWRPYEAVRNPEAVLYTETLRGLLPLRPELSKLGQDDVIAGRWPAVNVALLLTDSGQLYQYDQTRFSTLAPLEEVHERKVLNAWLDGLNLQEFLEEIGKRNFRQGLRRLNLAPRCFKVCWKESLPIRCCVATGRRI